MALTRIKRRKLKEICEEVPECSRFLTQFFAPVRERVEWGRNLEIYMDFLTKGMSNEKYAKIFRLSNVEFCEYRETLIDAFHSIAVIDLERKPSY